jgi:hypothetical protein
MDTSIAKDWTKGELCSYIWINDIHNTLQPHFAVLAFHLPKLVVPADHLWA